MAPRKRFAARLAGEWVRVGIVKPVESESVWCDIFGFVLYQLRGGGIVTNGLQMVTFNEIYSDPKIQLPFLDASGSKLVEFPWFGVN
jgi:hypothetical protein